MPPSLPPSLIQPLPQDVVHLIAAGEVIDSIAAVVRELAENAIDAKATHLTVTVDVERWSIQVVDNGIGLSLEDLRQAAIANSTSKIFQIDDLRGISSLGFRGEALHSLAQLSALEICSYQRRADQGWRVGYGGHGQPTSTEPAAIAPGTVVTVQQLFQRLEQRRQALPPKPQQLRQVQLTICALALCHPHLTWQVAQGSRPWFKLYPGTMPQVMAQILRLPAADLVEHVWLGGGDPALPCRLVMALPDRRHRHRPDWATVAINGRVVQCPALEQSILGAFHRTLPRGRYPICAVHLSVEPAQVDWNRHPAKSEIHLQQMDGWREQIKGAIAAALRQGLAAASDNPMPRTSSLFAVGESGGEYGVAGGAIGGDIRKQTDEKAIAEAGRPGNGDGAPLDVPLLPLTVLAQVHNTYILVEHPSGLWLVEQHIAHERVIYEQLCDRWRTVPLESPLVITGLPMAQVERLQQLGIVIEPFGEDVWAARSVPEALLDRQDCAEALREISQEDPEAAIVATACRTAIRNGTPLALPQMQTLVDQWQRTRQPQTCPHGRPIYLSLAESQLARFFRRHWVIGKSHGI
ncbi:MAG: DNA mismatch repair endonuclease MutL [Elainellaceae cyanobacterium]